MRASALLAAIGVSLLGGCSPSPSGSDSKLVVAASIHPLGSLASEIAGPQAEIVVFLPPGASPHSYEASPGLTRRAARARVFVRVGAGLDDWAADLAAPALKNGAPELKLMDWVESPLPNVEAETLADETRPDDHGHSPGELDPHAWLDPLALLRFCRTLGEELERCDPPRAEEYRRRTEACVDSLERLDADLRRILAGAQGIPFVATHNGWSYLCRRYGLRQLEVVHPTATRSPGPKHLVAVIESARRAGARAVFTEVQLPQASARMLAEELGLPVVLLDPYGIPDDAERDRYFDLLRWNARRMAAVLDGANRGQERTPSPGETTPS